MIFCPWCKYSYEIKTIENIITYTVPFCINCSNLWPDTFLFQHFPREFIAQIYLPRQVDLIMKADKDISDKFTLLIPLQKICLSLMQRYKHYREDEKYNIIEITEDGRKKYTLKDGIYNKMRNLIHQFDDIKLFKCIIPCVRPCYGFIVNDCCNICKIKYENILTGLCPCCDLVLTYQNILDPLEQIFCPRCKNIFHGGTLDDDYGVVRNKDALTWFAENQIQPLSISKKDRDRMISSIFYRDRWPRVFQQRKRLFHTILWEVTECPLFTPPGRYHFENQRCRILNYLIGCTTEDEWRDCIRDTQLNYLKNTIAYDLFVVLHHKIMRIIFDFYKSVLRYDDYDDANMEKILSLLAKFYSDCDIHRTQFNMKLDATMTQCNITEYLSLSPFWTLRDKRKYDFEKYSLDKDDWGNVNSILPAKLYRLEDDMEYAIRDEAI